MKPFKDYDLSAELSAQWRMVNEEIEGMTYDEVLANEETLLSENTYQKFYIEPVEILKEDTSRRRMLQGKIEKYIYDGFDEYEKPRVQLVPGVKTYFFYPFNGFSHLFFCYSSRFNLAGYPEIDLDGNYLIITIEKTNREMSASNIDEKIMEEQRSVLKKIQEGIADNNKQIVAFNNQLKKEAIKSIKKKKDDALLFVDLAKKLEIPVQKSEYAKQHIDIKRRVLPIKKKYERQPYYAIKDEEYFDILSMIKHTLSTFERTPSSFKKLGEEDIRNILLATLNSVYLGEATGETFRNKGKTDICIEKENRAAFIAECKFWEGKAALIKAIKQLDGYLTWRDHKVAIIFFVRKKKFVSIIEKIPDILNGVEEMLSIEEIDKNEYACQYISRSDGVQKINIRVMLFDLYAE